MNNFLFLISGYFFIFFSIIFVYFRLKQTSLTQEDNYYWLRINKTFRIFKEKAWKFFQVSGKEINILLRNLIEKILLRIKIEAMKIETWANKKLEKLREMRADLNKENTNSRE